MHLSWSVVCRIEKYDAACKKQVIDHKDYIKTHLTCNFQPGACPANQDFAQNRRVRTCRNNHKKSATKIKLEINPKSIQCVPNHHKTPVFDHFYSSKYTHYVLMVFTAQFRMRPILVDVLRALCWHNPREAKKFHDFKNKIYTYHAQPPLLGRCGIMSIETLLKITKMRKTSQRLVKYRRHTAQTDLLWDAF